MVHSAQTISKSERSIGGMMRREGPGFQAISERKAAKGSKGQENHDQIFSNVTTLARTHTMFRCCKDTVEQLVERTSCTNIGSTTQFATTVKYKVQLPPQE